MQKHKPFGWVKYGESICNIQNITSDSITIIDYEEIYFLRFSESFTNLTFIDGTQEEIETEYELLVSQEDLINYSNWDEIFQLIKKSE